MVPPKAAASCLTVCLLCWFLVGSRVGASLGGRMSSGKGGSGADSMDGEGETHTAPLGGGCVASSVACPKRGASAGAGCTERGELVALAGLGRELLRLLAGLRATDPPACRWRGDAALLLALSESALLGERTGEALGAGLIDRGRGSPPA